MKNVVVETEILLSDVINKSKVGQALLSQARLRGRTGAGMLQLQNL